MQIFIFIVFIVLLLLMFMRAWFVMKNDKSGQLTFWEAVNQLIDEDEIENKQDKI